MGAIANLTLTDAAATPVNHTYYPQPDQFMTNLARWVDRGGGIALGYPVATLLFRMPTRQSRAFKVSVKLVLPTLEVTSPSTSSGIQPAPTLAYNHIASAEYVIPERGTLQERKDLNALFKDLLGDAVVTAAVESQDPPY